jgi:hypothetical protein
MTAEVIWESNLDNRYDCKVTRNLEYTGQLKVLDTETNQVLLDEEVRLSYGASFGPDVFDVADWRDKIIAVVDGES